MKCSFSATSHANGVISEEVLEFYRRMPVSEGQITAAYNISGKREPGFSGALCVDVDILCMKDVSCPRYLYHPALA